MKSHRKIIHIFVLLAAVAAVLPAPALASSLLSGYGGPGQGNQAVLGSALINGPKHGGGSGGGSGSSAAAGQGASAQTNTTSESYVAPAQSSGSESEHGTAAPAGKGGTGGKGGSTNGGNGARADSGNGKHAPAQHAAAKQATFYPAAERVPAGAQGSTIPASDVLYVILGAAILLSLGLLTRRAGGVTREEGSGS